MEAVLIKKQMLMAIMFIFAITLALGAVSAEETVGSPDNSSTSTNSSDEVHGYWIWASDVHDADVTELKNNNITDVYVLTRSVSGNTYNAQLQEAIAKFGVASIKVHSWIVCFKDGDHFVNPSGYYSYSTQVYVTTTKRWGWKAIPYKVKVRAGKYKVGKRWKYTYRYVTKYKYRKGWIYTPIYRTETRSGYDTSYNDRLTNYISDISNNYNVTGIHLDYVRYSGVEKYGNAAWQQPGGSEAATTTITRFVQKIRERIDAINNQNITGKSYIQLSAAVMPEGTTNARTYGQDYGQIGKYVDYLVPMIYKGNYGKDTAWIGETTSKIKALSGNKTIIAGLQTYYSDNNAHGIPKAELQTDIDTAIGSGASGFVLFRYEAHNTHTADIDHYLDA
ncbi:putative glycoside hydrolase [Methanobacterium sp. ACI-7]|uniref:putative glycoside hydrolase n=1 Tax=unclassified Methanobacterium TaxID=2627676 RepID=UPI0039C42432